MVPSPSITFKGSLTICHGVKAIADDDRGFASGDKTMFIAMNRFRVKRGAEDALEKVWLNRDSYLERVPGFVEFHLLKDPRPKTIRSTPHIRCGRAKPPSRRGPNRRSFALRMRVQATIRPERSIWSIRN
jgi:Antibiotic biosynthesis monooxygenase